MAGTTRRQILVVDDNVVNRKATAQFLEFMGYEADAVNSGAEAIEKLEQAAYDMVIMDCQMPEMDGWETTSLIRSPHSKVLDPTIPILAVTGYTSADEVARCREAGMNDYISKPLDVNAFVTKIETLFSTRSP